MSVWRHRLFWPVLVLAALLASNLFFAPRFFAVRLQDGHLYGSLVDIARNGAPLILVALGMTLVIATGGIDLSVGSVMAISGALACVLISDLGDQNSVGGVLAAIAAALLLSLLAGVWNGLLVAVAGIQPIIATLILMVAGRGIAQLITSGQIINVRSGPYRVIGGGYALALPVSVLIAAAAVALAVVLTRRTALGLLIESVGDSPTASRLAGIQARTLMLMVYVFAAVCAGVAGLIYSSNVASADSNAAGNLIELDAILAVVIGGTALAGGRFSLAGSVLGAVIIQTLNVTCVSIGIPVETTLLFKAIVVIILCLMQSATFRAVVTGRFRRPPPASPSPAAAPAPRTEIPA
ncbi:ABC transporter permease [Mangrovihabitans endophyticus]|uniref:Sugar ABC transporter permease n=1 Tax=Mangrovihabitans endophyticus TaxID=1751298 RepID=A0A8J3C211_9ACTN|nr:ABC transporter permease [Mangrovihabitans endophyticus]GGL07290.1 sugar ABC transporter permease [Mangrovihabitans endophyticus]